MSAQEQELTPATSTSGRTASQDETSGQHSRKFDFGFLPIPSRLRHDPKRPFKFHLWLNISFGFAATMTVCNLYYCQPLLEAFRKTFPVDESRIATVPTLTQSGYAAGLLLVSPLGDIVPRRPLILLLLLLSSAFSLAMAVAPSLSALQTFSFFLGAFTVTPQVLMPLAADLAPPARRASAIAIVLSGLLLGILFARVLAGIIGQFSGSDGAGWRNVYWLAFAVQTFTLVGTWAVLPDWPAKNKGNRLTYHGILWSMAKFMFTEPVLLHGCIIVFLGSAVFSNFWVTLTFILSRPPYNYNTLQIGLFGLVGMLGVATAPFVGRIIDRLVPWMGTLIALLVLLLSQTSMIIGGGLNIAAVIITCFGIDVGFQTQQISLATSIYAIEPGARARLNADFIISVFLGQVVGTSAGTAVFQAAGWRASAGLSVGFVGMQLFVLLSRGPHCKRHTWIGWQGRWRMKKQSPADEEKAQAEVTCKDPDGKQINNPEKAAAAVSANDIQQEDKPPT